MAARANIIFDQGTTFNTSITLNDTNGNPIDLSTYTVNAQIRKNYTSSNSVSFTTSANSSGIISLSLDANTSANLSSGRYVYDVLVTSNTAATTRVIEGQVTVSPSVSR